MMRRHRSRTSRAWTPRVHLAACAIATIAAGSVAAFAAPAIMGTATPEPRRAVADQPLRLAQADPAPEKSMGERASEFFDSFLNRPSAQSNQTNGETATEPAATPAPGILDRAQDVLSGARKSYADEVVPRLKAGGGFDKPDPGSNQAQAGVPASGQGRDRSTPGGGLSLPSGQSFVDGVRALVERAMRGYQGEIVPRLSGGVPATAVTEAEQRRAQDRDQAANRAPAGETDRAGRDAAIERERQLQAEISRRDREAADARRRAEAEQLKAEQERRQAERKRLAQERAAELERERARRAERDAVAARESAEERQRQAARDQAAEDLRATQRDAERARQRAELERRARDATARRERASTETPPRPRTAEQLLAALKDERRGDWSALRERALAASRSLEGLMGEAESELGRRLGAFEALRRRRLAEQQSVDQARRALSRAVGDEARAAAGERSDKAEATLEAVRTAYQRRRQNAESYSQTTTTIRAERARVQTAVRLVDDAYTRLSGSIGSTAEVEREDLRLRRGTMRAEAALERAQRAFARAPADISDTISPSAVRKRVSTRTRSETPELPIRRMPPAAGRERSIAARPVPPVSRPLPVRVDREAVSGTPRTADRSGDRSRDRASSDRRPTRGLRSDTRLQVTTGISRARTRRVAAYRKRLRRQRRLARHRAAHRRQARHQCHRAGRLVRRGRKYVVRRGDSLWRIARRHYGRGAKFRRIFQANRSKIRNPDLIYPCQRFRVPRRR